MIDGLKVINLPATSKINIPVTGEIFILKTCQRTLVAGLNIMPLYLIPTHPADMEVYVGEEAYHYLLETICGLKSKIVGENEIVNQFKIAYSAYLNLDNKNPHIMSILERLFKDAKEVRTTFLKEIGQQSYAGIARKLLHKKAEAGKVLILGSGELAKDLINLLGRNYQITLSARNDKKVQTLIKANKNIQIDTLPWRDYKSYSSFSFIVNTIGVDEVLFDNDFFNKWLSKNKKKSFVDLGSPSVLDTNFNVFDDVIRLEDVFDYGNKLNKEKEIKVTKAKEAIEGLVEKRRTSFVINMPFGWEEMKFA